MPTKTATEPKIEIPPLEIVRLRVRIEGDTPLICHRFSEEAQKSIEGAQQGAAKTKKPPRDPQREFEAACYRHLDSGGFGFPAIGVKKAMVSAGQRFGGEKSTELFGAFSIPVEMLELDADEPEMRSDRVVLSGIGRTSSIAYRPAFWPWGMWIPLIINQAFLSPDQAVNLLRLAGFSVGIGDWRVERKGSFGQFRVGDVIAEPGD